MATFFLFGKYSSEALKGMSPDRTDTAVDRIKDLDGKVEAIYALLGEYDLVFITEFRDFQRAMQASVALSKMTGVSFTTSPAVSVKEFDRLMDEV